MFRALLVCFAQQWMMRKICQNVFAYVPMCNFTKTLCSESYQEQLTVVVEWTLLTAVVAGSIRFKHIIGRMDLFPLLDSSWQFHRTPTSSLLYTTHWIRAQHRSKSTWTNIQRGIVDITTLQSYNVVLEIYMTVSYWSDGGNSSYTSGHWFNSSQAHYR